LSGLALGLLVLFVSAPLTVSAAHDGGPLFRRGLFFTTAGAVLLAVWPLALMAVIFPVGEAARVECMDDLGGTGGRITDITPSLIPAQVYCDTTQGVRWGAIFSGWESAGLTGVTLLLAASVVNGVWLIASPRTPALAQAERLPDRASGR
jgi:hypothetical protein